MFYNIAMKNSKTLSVTLPPDMLRRAHALAKRESRTMSELVREALRHYERRTWWDEVNAYGASRAELTKSRAEDIDRLIRESRRERAISEPATD
jgi:predicted transcriptional regulator